MRTEAKFGTFEELLEDTPTEVEEICKALRKTILMIHPDATEVVRLGDQAACYGVGPKKMSEAHTYIMPKRGYANLGFFYGALLNDKTGLLEGTGKKMRHIKVRSIDEAKSAGLQALVEAALAERQETLGLS